MNTIIIVVVVIAAAAAAAAGSFHVRAGCDSLHEGYAWRTRKAWYDHGYPNAKGKISKRTLAYSEGICHLCFAEVLVDGLGETIADVLGLFVRKHSAEILHVNTYRTYEFRLLADWKELLLL